MTRVPVSEEAWCAERREEVAEYLRSERLVHGAIGEWPAWHVHPYVSVWAVESLAAPGSVGWWAISGDLPCDYVTARRPAHPRDALRKFAQRWLELVPYLERGEIPPTMRLGSPTNAVQLAPLLQSRAQLLLEWAENDDLWSA